MDAARIGETSLGIGPGKRRFHINTGMDLDTLHARPDGRHNPRPIRSRRIGQGRKPGILARSDIGFHRIHARGFQPHQHLALPRF
jgi:hypothetical protein